MTNEKKDSEKGKPDEPQTLDSGGTGNPPAPPPPPPSPPEVGGG